MKADTFDSKTSEIADLRVQAADVLGLSSSYKISQLYERDLQTDAFHTRLLRRVRNVFRTLRFASKRNSTTIHLLYMAYDGRIIEITDGRQVRQAIEAASMPVHGGQVHIIAMLDRDFYASATPYPIVDISRTLHKSYHVHIIYREDSNLKQAQRLYDALQKRSVLICRRHKKNIVQEE